MKKVALLFALWLGIVVVVVGCTCKVKQLVQPYFIDAIR